VSSVRLVGTAAGLARRRAQCLTCPLVLPVRVGALCAATVVNAMAPEMAQAGEAVIRQGDTGDKFYVIEDGSLDVEVDGATVTTMCGGQAFGELALM
jgi:CRP-like cAMP-binding protein